MKEIKLLNIKGCHSLQLFLFPHSSETLNPFFFTRKEVYCTLLNRDWVKCDDEASSKKEQDVRFVVNRKKQLVI